MNPIEIKIHLRTPVWTGGIDGPSKNLKISGIIGGMREAFEMLVRKAGGHTCDITGPADHRCNYERDRRICPACQLFGCTGLSRAFNMCFEPGLEIRKIVVPESDPKIHNRPHYTAADWNNGKINTDLKKRFRLINNHVEYNQSCSTDTWLAGCLGLQMPNKQGQPGLPPPHAHQEAQTWLSNHVNVFFSSQPIQLKFVPLRPLSADLSGGDLAAILRHLLRFMSQYSGLGAKVRQGWGVFELENDTDTERKEKDVEIFRRFVSSSHFQHNEWDKGHPNAADCFSAEWELNSQNLGFTWPQNLKNQSDPYRQTGFAMNYRLRRHIKFYEVDSGNKIPVGAGWRGLGGGAPWNRVPWKEAIGFVRAVFGRDNAGDTDKHAGLVGTSHLYHKEGKWYVRFFGRIPDAYEYPGNGELSWDANQVRNFLIEQMTSLLTKEQAVATDSKPKILTGGNGS